MHFVVVAPGDRWFDGRRPFLSLLAEAAAATGARLEMEAQFGHVGRLHRPDGQIVPIYGNALGQNVDAAAALAADKDYTARLLAAKGLPVPQGLLVFSPAYAETMGLKNLAVARALPGEAQAIAWAEAQGYPVIVKPNGGSEGRGISVAPNAAALRRDLTQLFKVDQKVRIEALYSGADYRVVVWNDTVRMAYRRDPACVIGDGTTELGTLIEALCRRLAHRARGPKLDPKSAAVTACLSGQGLALDTVPAPGQHIPVLPNANLSTGGSCTDVTDQLPRASAKLAIAAAAHLGLRLAGVDILAPDLTQGPDQAKVLEVNSAPGFDGYASASPENWARAGRLLQDVFTSARRL